MKKLLLSTTVVFILTVAHGQTTFQKIYGTTGTGGNSGFSICKTLDSGYAIAGYTFINNWDYYLIKTNSIGDTLWTKAYGGTWYDYALSVQQTTDSGFIVSGYSRSFSSVENILLVKTDKNGNAMWTKTYGGTSGPYISFSIQQTNDGGYLIGGYTGFEFSVGAEDLYLIKTNSVGDTLWTKTYGGSQGDIGYSAQQTIDGGYAIVGNTLSFGAGSNDVYLIKTDSLGNHLWSKTYGGSGWDQAYSFQQTADSGYVIAGYSESFGAGNKDVYVIKTDINGNVMWFKNFGDTLDETAWYVQQTSDGGYVICGETNTYGAGSLDDVLLIKTNALGNMQWSSTFGGTNADLGLCVKEINNGYVIVGCTYSFGASNGSVYFIQTDSTGNSACNQNNPITISNSSVTVTNPLTQTSSGGTIGNPTLYIGSGALVNTLCMVNGVNDSKNERLEIKIFPNPFSTQTVLQIDNRLIHASLTVYNSFGQQVKQIKNISGQTIIFHRDNLPSGLYFIRLTEDNKIFTDKLVITDN